MRQRLNNETISSLTNPFILFLQIVIICMLVISVFEMPSWYYRILRWTIFVVYLSAALFLLYKDKVNHALFLIFISIVFNPILQFYLEKSNWIFMDIIAIVGSFNFNLLKNSETEGG